MERHPNPDDLIGHESMDTKIDLAVLRKLKNVSGRCPWTLSLTK